MILEKEKMNISFECSFELRCIKLCGFFLYVLVSLVPAVILLELVAKYVIATVRVICKLITGRMDKHSSFSRIACVYAYFISKYKLPIAFIHFHSHKCLSLDDKLYGYLNYKGVFTCIAT